MANQIEIDSTSVLKRDLGFVTSRFCGVWPRRVLSQVILVPAMSRSMSSSLNNGVRGNKPELLVTVMS